LFSHRKKTTRLSVRRRRRRRRFFCPCLFDLRMLMTSHFLHCHRHAVTAVAATRTEIRQRNLGQRDGKKSFPSLFNPRFGSRITFVACLFIFFHPPSSLRSFALITADYFFFPAALLPEPRVILFFPRWRPF